MDELQVPEAAPGRAIRLTIGLATLALTILLSAGRLGAAAMTSGTAMFYDATVDNMTLDPSLQIARPAT